MPVQGMDIDRVDLLALRLGAVSDLVEEETQRVTALVAAVVGDAWQGPDAEHFRSDFLDRVRPLLHHAADELRQVAQRARHEARQQEAASQL